MKQLISLLCLLTLSLPVFAADKPANLDELLQQVKRERVLEQQQNQVREAEFAKAHDQQASLLAQAKQELADQEKRTQQLNTIFNEQEQRLAEQQSLLDDKSGSLGELFGTVRQVANDSRAVLESSMTNVQHPERVDFLNQLSDSKQQPTIEELRQLWLTLQEEMTASGKVEKFTTPVITTTGDVEDKQVTRIGVFTAFTDGLFLRYLPETGNLVELARQPVDRFRKLVAEFEDAQPGELLPTVIDPTRGAIMALLVQTPTLKERIEQGGWIGYIILVLGAIGLIIALIQFLSLTKDGHGIAKQQKQKEVSQKNPLGRILSVYNDRLAHDVETLSLKLDEAILREMPKLERGLITLAILAAVAPMLGLLGTVSGMIETFQSITLFGTGDPKLMSGGISQALVTTELGLAVAIPLLLIHSGLSSKSNRLVQILDEESAAIVARNAEKQHDQSV
ncbi:MAG TPA: MotA/TolQ/ExbB proton channel family protein [Methylophaga aminisulfidivorans]|jgi:biopolymer transport protein ExbB|uniref:Biopolymer transport protein n=2 Tax=Methylophaga TaxID=40222 RepID=F5T391_9GAMM|nr:MULTISPECIES: MotA/TolQ/ExbB proton channel family protein [Methylophaga]EGL53583.1 biopolymer transport protein [Methylophaga aminisulfidivorans MP]GLQ00045.1 biopolymer transporter ExbB [Methylophaga thalassica]HIC46733.1 MotA/TolQ/ExbB proton channel family protein [Methylophaga sp.]HIM39454.1 MotA/TolQ/ExbB proton channel family protein [Methylophaga aminisulfidivorans]